MNNFDLETYLNDMLINNQIKSQNNNQPNSSKSINNNLSLYGPYEGFIRGNLFTNSYDSYQNYIPAKLIPKTEYEEDLLNLNQIQFAYHELNLLLDNYPEDKEILNLFNKYRQSFNNLLQDFESKYGPVTTLSKDLNKSPWEWNNEPWPWEGDAN